MKHYAAGATKSKKLFLASRSKSRSQGHWPRCHLKGVISGVCMPNMKSLSLYSSKVIAKVKVDTD